MGLWNRAVDESGERPPRRLTASDEAVLGRELDSLPPGRSGWIAFEDHDRLFATTDVKSGPHLWDDAGLEALEKFTAAHDCTLRTVDAEKRVYFSKNANDTGERKPRGKGPRAFGWETYIGISVLAGMIAYWLLSAGDK